jgi:hypothetical protein
MVQSINASFMHTYRPLKACSSAVSIIGTAKNECQTIPVKDAFSCGISLDQKVQI